MVKSAFDGNILRVIEHLIVFLIISLCTYIIIIIFYIFPVV